MNLSKLARRLRRSQSHCITQYRSFTRTTIRSRSETILTAGTFSSTSLFDNLRRSRPPKTARKLRLFSNGELAGNYSEKNREYRELLRRIWETNHQSCILLLSREEPSELAVMLDNNSSIHSLPLGVIGAGGREIFRAKGLSNEERWDDAIEYLGGNPAYLESVSIAIKKLFGGKVGEFCKYEELFLTEEIESLLTYQFSRLSIAEQEVIKLLAGEAEPIGISRSIESLNMSPADVGKAIISLGRRGSIVGGSSAMENQSQTDDGAVFSLRSIVKKFILQL